MHFMTKKWLLPLLLIPALHAGAQSIRLTPIDAPGALYFNVENAVNYNMYEHWRYEMNVTWVYPNESSKAAKNTNYKWNAKGYFAYTTRDKDYKYGLSSSVQLLKNGLSFSASAFNDMIRAADRNLGTYSLLNPSANTNFVASYFVGVKGAMVSADFKPLPRCLVTLGFRQTWEDYRFDGRHLLFPAIDPRDQLPFYSFSEGVARVEWKKDLILSLRGGYIGNYTAKGYLRAILQYKHAYFNNQLSLFSQAGFATKGAPYSRMFDLSGTAFSGYFFNNTFLTVRPNTFAANTYAHVCLNYTMAKPLWTWSFSSPKPFAQLNAMWGSMFGQDEQGRLYHDGLGLKTPYQGLLEPAIGIDGILRWGVMDFGVAVAYQVCPAHAAYRNADPENNWAFAVVGNLNIPSIIKIR